MAAAHEVFDLSPTEASRVDLQRDPAVLPDIRRAEKARIIEKNPLQFLLHLDADSQFAFIFLEYAEHPAVDSECGMAEGGPFSDITQTNTNRAQPLQDLAFTQHLGNEAGIR